MTKSKNTSKEQSNEEINMNWENFRIFESAWIADRLVRSASCVERRRIDRPFNFKL